MSEKIFNSEILKNNIKINIENTSQTLFNDSKSLNNSKRYKHYLPNLGRLGQFNKNLNKNNSNYLNSTNELTINIRSYSNKEIKKIPNNLKLYHYYDSINNNIINNRNDDDLDYFENENIKSNKKKIKKIIKNTVLNNLYSQSDSIYKDLALEKSKMINLINLRNKSYSNSQNYKKRKICLENIPITNFLNAKKNENDLLITDLNYIPIITDLDEKNLNISEKNRYQNIMEELYKLKNLILKNPDEENQIINEFLINHHIDDIKLYDIEKINNFSNFLKTNFTINMRKSIKENIKDILNGKYPIINKNIQKDKKEKQKLIINKNDEKDLKGFIINNLTLQTQLYLNEKNRINNYNLDEKPEKIIQNLETEFRNEIKKEENLPIIPPFRSINLNNQNLYRNIKTKIDFDDIKNKKKITEFVCYFKAKKNNQLNKFKKSDEDNNI